MQLPYAFLADSVVVLHMLFVLFVVSGGFWALKWPKIAYGHIPSAIWGVYIEFSGKICPLTPLENWLRIKSGRIGYEGDFIERYVIPIIYPANLTRDMQFTLGMIALSINVLAYGLLLFKFRNGRIK